jgi:hypothetical protein
MKCFLYGCGRWLPIHKLRFEDVLFDSSDNWSNERLIPAYDLNILNFPIGSDCHC